VCRLDGGADHSLSCDGQGPCSHTVIGRVTIGCGLPVPPLGLHLRDGAGGLCGSLLPPPGSRHVAHPLDGLLRRYVVPITLQGSTRLRVRVRLKLGARDHVRDKLNSEGPTGMRLAHHPSFNNCAPAPCATHRCWVEPVYHMAAHVAGIGSVMDREPGPARTVGGLDQPFYGTVGARGRLVLRCHISTLAGVCGTRLARTDA
jgi:hypothetical protein